MAKIMAKELINEGDNKPWYRQFWAWFILSPLIVVFIVSSITITLAVKYGQDRVLDNYYKEGRLINMRLEQDLLAITLGINAQLNFDTAGDDLVLSLTTNTPILPDYLSLELSHPAHAERDHKLLLTRTAANQYNAELSAEELASRWYLRLSPVESPEIFNSTGVFHEVTDDVEVATNDTLWRLRGEIDFAETHIVTLQPDS